MRHIYMRVETVGTMGFPSPFKIPPITSFIPQIKYVLEIIIIFCLEYAIISGLELIIEESCPEKIADREPKLAPNRTVIIIARTMIFFTRFMFFAPAFCATYGITAREGATEI